MKETLEQQSLKNMVGFFEEDLKAINDGESMYDRLSYHTRRRMVEGGVLVKRFRKGYGPRYFLSEMALGMMK